MNIIEDIIAFRELNFKDSTEKVYVYIGKPQKFSENTDYYCQYQIKGIGNEKIKRAAGIDSIQSLLLALKMVGADLYCSEEAKQKKIKWEGSDGFDLGFPLPSSIAYLDE